MTLFVQWKSVFVHSQNSYELSFFSSAGWHIHSKKAVFDVVEWWYNIYGRSSNFFHIACELVQLKKITSLYKKKPMSREDQSFCSYISVRLKLVHLYCIKIKMLILMGIMQI